MGLLFENGSPFVAASLGAIKAGHVQMSLESSFPEARLRHVLEQASVGAILTNRDHLALAHSLFSGPIINVDELNRGGASNRTTSPIDCDAPLVIDYTSGSTGPPKGMAWSAAGLLQVVARHTSVSHLCHYDRLAMFRASVRAYLSVLLNGGTFCPIDSNKDSPRAIADWLRQSKVTVYRAAVSTFRSLVNVLRDDEILPHLRLILLFGEPACERDLQSYRAHCSSQCLLGSSLGCNEMDDYAYYFVDQASRLGNGTIPGGYPVDDLEVSLRGKGGRPVPEGTVGEICVRANYPNAGYWRRPELKKSAFWADGSYRTGDIGLRQADGCIDHLGRKDSQTKIRGYRVDIAEVEARLLQEEGIKEAVVVAREGKRGNARLIAYLIPDGAMPSVTSLRRSLREKMPDYAIPSLFLAVARIPMTATGKVDRRALPAPDRVRPCLDHPRIGPRTEVERTLARIWSEVVEIDDIGVTDQFSELGGDSLLATDVVSAVIAEFAVRPSLHAMLEAATIEEMALIIASNQAEAQDEAEVAHLLAEVEAMSEEDISSASGAVVKRTMKSSLALVVPFHNEDRHIGWIIRSLREQKVQEVPIIFVNNGSTDQSSELVLACDEVRSGKWFYLEETAIGKVRAMRTATEFCHGEFRARAIGFLDSDSYLGDADWVGHARDLVDAHPDNFGYSYSPLAYFGFEEWKVFRAAYHSYAEVLRQLVRNVGWLANGQGYLCATEILQEYFAKADVTCEVDLRTSLLALTRGRRAVLNPTLLVSSGRRMVANSRNFAAWCFYDRNYYCKKDINASAKTDLKVSDRMRDLDPLEVDTFFERRSLKAMARHLVPLMIFSGSDFYLERMSSFLELGKTEQLSPELARFRSNEEYLLTDRFEEMIMKIEQEPLTLRAAARLTAMTKQQHESSYASSGAR